MVKYEKFYLVDFSKIIKYIELNKTHIINIDQLKKYGYELEIIFPGILNLIEVLNKINS